MNLEQLQDEAMEIQQTQIPAAEVLTAAPIVLIAPNVIASTANNLPLIRGQQQRMPTLLPLQSPIQQPCGIKHP